MNHPVLKIILSVRKAIIFSLVLSFFINLLLLASPLYMLQVYDRVLSSRSLDTLFFLTIIVISAILCLCLLEAIRSAIAVKTGLWMDKKVSSLLLPSVVKISLQTKSELSGQGLRDMGTVRSFITGNSMFSLMDVPWMPLYLLVLYLLHPILGLLALGGALFIFMIAVVNELLTRKYQQNSNALVARAYGFSDSVSRNADVVEAMGMVPQIVSSWQKMNDESSNSQQRALGFTGWLGAVSRFIRLGLQVAILGMGALLAINGEISAGAIIAASILVGRALQPVEQSINSWRSATSAWDAYIRVKQQLLATPAYDDQMELPNPEGKLSIEGLSYAFPGSQQAYLKGISFRVGPGQLLAIMGPSGSGKTTLVRLLLGNLKPNSGFARLDGMDMSMWHSDDRGKHIGYLPQDVELFAGTVKENIARMANGVTDQIINASKMAGVHEMIMRLPQGYDTQIGSHGMSLSGGQRQRIGLARALYGEPKLLVLDEPNSSLDQQGEGALMNALKAVKEKNITTVVISHRPSVLEHADLVLLMQEGMVANFGPRDEVLKVQPASVSTPRNNAVPIGKSAKTAISYTIKK
ncbi:type I secretion system permease/ATPase [Neptuniibacter sp. QD48_11]|uniref:type I secretion system permease/ATPase n=1 Tax=Neptuniibacter sp. QD48_11 TaxID=3398211 RepID=UPI0039F5D14E